MKMLRTILLTLTVCFAFGSIASADVINQPSINDETAIVTIEGKISGASYGDSFALYVYKPDKTPDDLTEISEDKFMELLASYDQYYTSDDGSYSLEFGMKGMPAGVYTAVLTSELLTKAEQKTFYFASKDEKLKYIGEIKKLLDNTSSTASDLKAKLNLADDHNSATAMLLNIGEGNLILTVNETGLSNVLFELLKEDNSSLVSEKPADFVDVLYLAALIQSLNDGPGNITDERLNLDKTFVTTYNGLSDAVKESFVSDYFKNSDCKSLEDVSNLFEDSVALSVLKTADGWQDYKNLIDSHGKALGIDMDDYEDLKSPSDVTRYLKNSYSSIDKFVDDVNDAIKKIKSGVKESSSGSSGGKGSFYGGSTAPLDFEELDIKEYSVYSDVASDHWAYESIKALTDLGAIAGRGDGSFAPEASVTREEFVKIAVVAFGIEITGDTETAFGDVDEGAWYASYVNAAVNAGMVRGISEDTFGTGRTITRQEAATILYRTAIKLGYAFEPAQILFEDDSSVADWAKEAVYALKGAGIINGVTEERFAPLGDCSRAQSAKLIHGLSGRE